MVKVLLIGPLTKVGGLSKYISDILDSSLGKDIYHFNIARPLKKKIKNADRGYKGFINAGFFRVFKSILITSFHLSIFPFIMFIKRPKIVHIAATGGFVFWEDSIYILISKLYGKKIFIHYLGSFDIFFEESSFLERKLITYVFNKSDFIGVLSKKVKVLVGSIYSNTNNILIIPSSINFKLFANNNVLLKKNNKIRILFLGGFDAYKKGVIDIVSVIPNIIAKNKNVEFIIGTSKKINISIDINIKNNIVFLEWIPENEKIPLYNSSDIFLLPSYDEGLPYTMIEAMAAGLPIISTYIGGIPEVIKHGINGYLLNPGDQNKMQEYILNLVNDSELRNTMGKNNKDLIKQNYSLSRNIKIINDTYNKLT